MLRSISFLGRTDPHMPAPSETSEDISANLAAVRSRIENALKSAGRKPGSAGLIAVSKGQSEAAIASALTAGQREFGENRVQETQRKWPAFKRDHPDCVLHLIGPLQSNKAADAVALFDVIHSVDREKLAHALAAEMDRQNRRPKLLIQVNTGEEPQKAGVAPEETDALVSLCRDELKLPLIGLMCIPPVDEEPSLHFALLREIARRNNLPELSMGMSGDFEIGPIRRDHAAGRNRDLRRAQRLVLRRRYAQRIACPNLAQYLDEIGKFQRDAAFGGAHVRACDVKEDRASPPRHDRFVVVSQDDDNVVEIVAAPQPLRARLVRQFDLPIIKRIFRVVAPPVAGADRGDRERRLRPRDLVGAVKHAPEREHAGRCGAIPLAFARTHPTLAERARIRGAAAFEHAGVSARLGDDEFHDDVIAQPAKDRPPR